MLTIKNADYKKSNIGRFPNAGPDSSIAGMKKFFGYGDKNHVIVKCVRYIYNVPKSELDLLLPFVA